MENSLANKRYRRSRHALRTRASDSMRIASCKSGDYVESHMSRAASGIA